LKIIKHTRRGRWGHYRKWETNAKIHILYSWSNIGQENQGQEDRHNMGENRNAYRILVGNPEGKTPLGTPRHR
jgi:hypothetical protein